MTNDITVIGEPKRSDEYVQLLDGLTEDLTCSYRSYISAEDKAVRLYERGKKDGLSNDLIRKDIETALDGIVKERRLREILPLELKRKYTVSQKQQDNGDSALSAESETSAQPESGTYSDNMAAFKKDVDASEAACKAKIIQMAQDLDIAGSVPKDRIATQIVYDLRDSIHQGIIISEFIVSSLPSEYKLPPKPEKKVYEYAPESEESKLTNVIINMIDTLSGISSDRAEKKPIEELIPESKDHMSRILLAWSDDQLIITRNALVPAVPLIRRFQELIEDEVRSRRANAKLLSR